MSACDFVNLQRRAVLEGIARGEEAIQRGRVLNHTQARERLARWLKPASADAAVEEARE